MSQPAAPTPESKTVAVPARAKGIQRIYKAFFYSMDGLAHAWCHETAVRQELMWSALAVPAALMIPGFMPVTRLILLLVILLLPLVELLNSAIEAVVNKASPEYHELAKQAKDMGSAAVLLAILMQAATWGFAVWEMLK